MIASTALDGVSYLTTGKSSTDHIISTALDEDCALHRVISGVAICQPEKDQKSVQTASLADPPVIGDDAAPDDPVADDPVADDSAANDDGSAADPAPQPPHSQAVTATTSSVMPHGAALESAGLGADMFFVPHRLDNGPAVSSGGGDGSSGKNGTAGNLADGQAKPAPPASGSVSTNAQPDAADTTDVNGVSTAIPSPATDVAAPDTTAKAAPVATTGKRFFIVLGSFAHKTNADRTAHGISDSAVRVVEIEISGRTFYRVVAGPFDRHGTIAARRHYADAGFGSAWPAPACEEAVRPGCIAQ